MPNTEVKFTYSKGQFYNAEPTYLGPSKEDIEQTRRWTECDIHCSQIYKINTEKEIGKISFRSCRKVDTKIRLLLRSLSLTFFHQISSMQKCVSHFYFLLLYSHFRNLSTLLFKTCQHKKPRTLLFLNFKFRATFDATLTFDPERNDFRRRCLWTL